VMQEIAENTAVYFNPFDPYDIAEKISFVFSEGFERDFYLKQKNKVLEKYSWGTSARQLLSVFESSEDLLLSGKCSTR
jgi:glycosyltransferase involved in cell wall biosynthesis